MTGKISEFDAQKEWVRGDVVIEVHGIAGVDEEIAGGVFDKDATAGHGEGVVGEGAAGFDPAGGQALEWVDRGRHTSVWRSSRERIAVEVEDVSANDKEESENQEEDGGAT